MWNESSLVAATTALVVTLSVLLSPNTLSDERLYQERCIACHQADGSGSEALQAPAIFGMSEAYLVRQLTQFKNGLRGGAEGDTSGKIMAASVAGLSADQFTSLSTHIARLKVVPLKQELVSAGFRGRGLYSGCGSCHGSAGEGYPELGAPRIASQYVWYTQRQLKNFRDDARGSHADDTYGQQMRAMAKAIADDQDITILANYIAGLDG